MPTMPSPCARICSGESACCPWSHSQPRRPREEGARASCSLTLLLARPRVGVPAERGDARRRRWSAGLLLLAVGVCWPWVSCQATRSRRSGPWWRSEVVVRGARDGGGREGGGRCLGAAASAGHCDRAGERCGTRQQTEGSAVAEMRRDECGVGQRGSASPPTRTSLSLLGLIAVLRAASCARRARCERPTRRDSACEPLVASSSSSSTVDPPALQLSPRARPAPHLVSTTAIGCSIATCSPSTVSRRPPSGFLASRARGVESRRLEVR